MTGNEVESESSYQWSIDYESPLISIQEPLPVGTGNHVPVSDPVSFHSWRVGRENYRMKRKAYWILALSVLLAALFLLASCIPVTIRPQFDDEHKPIAIPVTPVGSISPDGTLNPIYPVSDKAPSETNWGNIGAILGAITTALLAAYGINVRGAVGKVTEAARIACQLADANAEADTEDQVAKNKLQAQKLQIEAGVLTLTKQLRGK